MLYVEYVEKERRNENPPAREEKKNPDEIETVQTTSEKRTVIQEYD